MQIGKNRSASALPSRTSRQHVVEGMERNLSTNNSEILRRTLKQKATDFSRSKLQREELLEKIYHQALGRCAVNKGPNFDRVNASDLRSMIQWYDEFFFGASCIALAELDSFSVRWSSRMTRAGGKTTRTTWPATSKRPGKTEYEIVLSSSLLFQSFRESKTPIRVCGRVCLNRLHAMQRIVEHELIHLVEMLIWTDSNCAATRFQSIAAGLFGHTEHRHELTTQQERARDAFGIRLGDRVEFNHEGKQLIGFVNRITRRATVLVQDSNGEQYSDGMKYRKFYVPISRLRKA